MRIRKQTNGEIKSDIKYDKVVGFIYAVTTLFFMIIFAFYAFVLVYQHPVYRLIIFGFYSIMFCIIAIDYKRDDTLNKIMLEIRELKNK